MGRITSSIGAIVSGRVGNVVYYQLRGKSYVRAIPLRKKDSWTPAQQLHRKRISKVGELWKQLKSTRIAQIWNLASEEMNGYAYFMKINLSAFGADCNLTDPRELQLSTGKLRLPLELEAERTSPGSNTITVSWINDPQLKGIRLQDELMMVSSANGIYSVLTPAGLKRSSLGGLFTLPVKPVDATHVYLFFASQDGMDYTESVCFQI